MDLNESKPAMLAEYMGSQFDVTDELSNGFSLTLTEAAEHIKTGHNESFSLFFHGPLDRFIPQGIHRLNAHSDPHLHTDSYGYKDGYSNAHANVYDLTNADSYSHAKG